jgi:hypothetical protein
MSASGAGPPAYDVVLTGMKLASFEVLCPPGPAPLSGRGPGCAHRQTRSSFRVRPIDGAGPARTVRTAKDGRALVKLAPGKYRVEPLIVQRKYGVLGPAPAPQEVTVEADRFAAVIVDYRGRLPG